MALRRNLAFSYLAAAASPAGADDIPSLPPVVVQVRADSLVGEAAAGSEGLVSARRLATLPILRPGEALETVPGLIVTQHAGDGKANQYFLRGFNLDHGTDFATSVGGVPVNMPSHAHGQGYSDLNFLIPELVEQIRFRKGPYYAEEGDFASAGAAHIDYFRRLERGLAQATGGENGFARGLVAGSPALGAGRLLYGLEWFHNDGPWQVPEDYRKLNGVLRYSQGTRADGLALTAMAYRGRWISTDQVAQRAIAGGLVDRFGSLDPSTGGETRRYSLAGEWAGRGQDSLSRATVWALDSGLDLWSNFQYCLNNGCPPGDQFKQAERRRAGGFAASRAVFENWGGFEVENRIGLEGRADRLRPVGLYQTRERTTLATVREDRVSQKSVALWARNEVRWTPWLRSIAGLRGDAYGFRVDSSLPANSGTARDQLATPKLSLVLGPWRQTEVYLNYGHGFHSNDARGTTIRVDPADGTTPVDRVRPLVRTRGRELGVRSEPLPGWRTTVALWQLDVASELLFVGDAGTTEPSRPSRRHGLEWTNAWAPAGWLAIDADLSWSHARFRDGTGAGDHIPGAVTTTANVGLTVDRLGPWFGALRLRYVGPRPLVEDNSVRSAASALANARLGYRLDPSTQLALDIYNLLDRKANDIEYWYDSRLPGEGAASFDRHVHPVEPRTLRLTLIHRF
ncbi:MAG TPA: TonB-dependent receptor [Rhodocyclaceae bacterium]|nr:TonB-dependent receptor [Rhodocyclaceae bacterium]